MKYFIKITVTLLLAYLASIVYFWSVRPIERWPALDIITRDTLSKGMSEIKKHKVVIAGIVRDGIFELPAMQKYVEYTGNFFEDYRVVIFENDSKDGTKWFLSRWAKNNDKIKIISHDKNNIKKRPSISFLVTARNYYLDEIQTNPEYKDFDMMMVVDMDMKHGWDMRGVFDSFSKIQQWDSVCSNGIFTPNGRMYDLFAFYNKDFPYHAPTTPDYWTTKVHEGQKLVYHPGTDLVKAETCFGGMAFYKREFMHNCHYESITGDCDNVGFNNCLAKNGAKIMMNPSQIIRYREGNWEISHEPGSQKTTWYKIVKKIYTTRDFLYAVLDILFDPKIVDSHGS